MTTSFNDSNAMFTLAQQTEVPPSPHPTEASLIRHNNTVAGLVVLCQGLQTASGEGLINIDEEPWNALPRSIQNQKPDFSEKKYCVIMKCSVTHLPSLGQRTGQLKNVSIQCEFSTESGSNCNCHGYHWKHFCRVLPCIDC